MKLQNHIAVASLLIASAGISMGTPVTIRIVGSNGDRVATQTAISHLLASGWVYDGVKGKATASSLSKATGSSFGAWNGTFNGTPVIIKASYSGALAGIAAVAGGSAVQSRFVVNDGTGTGTLNDPTTNTAVLGTDYELGTTDFGFSTNFQSTSPFVAGVYNGITYSTVNETIVGVSPLGFYASPGFPGTNITTQLAQLLYTTGSVSVAQFTGNFASDQNKIVYAIGRNTDAGQRYGAFTEIGLGTTHSVQQWQPTVAGSTSVTGGVTYGGHVTSQALWPAETISTVFSPLGNGGYTTGALVVQNLTVTLDQDAYRGKYTDENNTTQYLYPNATAGYYIGYATPGDASTQTAYGLQSLSYNGVPLTSANIQNGSYTLWVYNRVITPTTGVANGTAAALATSLITQLQNADTTAGGGIFNDSSFYVQRFTDGGLVTPK